MKMYCVDSYWQSMTRSCHSVFHGSFEQCLEFAIQSYIGYNPRWTIFFGELLDSGLFFRQCLVARSSEFRTI